jgi:hypothetical protein
MHVSKKALVGALVPAATNSKNSSTSPLRSRHAKVGSESVVVPGRKSSSSEMRKTFSSSAGRCQ